MPGLEVAVADALLGIGAALHDVHGHLRTDLTVFAVGLGDGLLISGEVELHDLLVGGVGLGFRLTHMVGSFLGYTPYDTVGYRNLSAKTKNFSKKQ